MYFSLTDDKSIAMGSRKQSPRLLRSKSLKPRERIKETTEETQMESLQKLRLLKELKELELQVLCKQIECMELSIPQKEINDPCLLEEKSLAIPEQTAPGKESTNPLIPVALVKSKEIVQTIKSSLEQPTKTSRSSSSI